jgi:dipeptidyl aminopeptidase/acylaminoacyl peptidase
MRIPFPIIFTAMMPALSFSQDSGQIIASSPVAYPGYESVKNISIYYDKNDYLKATTDKHLATQKITYYSDSLKVVAFITAPKQPVQAKKYPVIIFNRGGYIRNDIAFVHAPLFKKLVDSGFIVIAPALRQSEGGEGKDEMGENDLHDVWNILPLIKRLTYADTSNLFMLGESRGGVMSLQLLKERFPVKAAAITGAFTDFELYLSQNPGLEKLCLQIWPDFDKQKETIFRQRSAVQWANEINVPLLVMAGSLDKSVNPGHSLDLAAQLNKFHREYQLLILNNGNHILSGNNLNKRDTEIINWFKKYLTK